ncbi:hypothetical protein N0V90_002024 [Kalmusia sp. IMI 367209]|nr:hypothetical protein N0V90_002024 [Kalmusia sp. IMI 367209]
MDLLVKYTYMDGVDPVPLGSLKKDIMPNLVLFIPIFQELTEEIVPPRFGQVEDWTPVNLYPIMLRMLAVMTARVMISPNAPHDQLWVELTEDYVLSAITLSRFLKWWHPALRPFVQYFMPDYKEVQHKLKYGRATIERTIKEQDEREAKGELEPKPTSVFYGLMHKLHHKTKSVIEWHLKEQMNLAVGGIHTTSSVLTQTLFEIVWNPKYTKPLREEARQSHAKCNGKSTKTILWDMHKLGSFIRETHRLNSPTIHRDESVYPNADYFDGLRFVKLRKEDPEGRHHYVSNRKDYSGWDIGKASCPGRFLADVEIKVVVACILLNYDLKNPEGQERQKSVIFENQFSQS